jgi:hypothetical protein
MQKDITVSKLSKLQKQILVYARKAMLAKGQSIEESPDVTIGVPAPEWLAKALTEAMAAIFKSRKTYLLGTAHMYEFHPWFRFFEEMRFLWQAIKDAAEEAGVKTATGINLLNLYELAVHGILFINFEVQGKLVIHSWPYFSAGRGWYFRVTVKETTAEQATQTMKDMVGEDMMKGIWVSDIKTYPVNCTVPELLRDVFGFAVTPGGHIDALAFSIKEIGKQRYNNAQAAIRRACNRLYARGLIELRAGQTHTLFIGTYERSGICLKEAGIAVADGFLQVDEQRARAELGIPLQAAAAVTL